MPSCAHLLANDVGKLRVRGKALYSCLLDEQGGVLDDLIVYFLSESWFRLVVNAGTRDKDLAWIRRHAAAFGVEVSERADLAMLAVQGPEARAKAAAAAVSRRRRVRSTRPGHLRRPRARRLVRRAHRLHRRGRLRDHDAGRAMPNRRGAS